MRVATISLLLALGLPAGAAGAAAPGFFVALQYEVSASVACPEPQMFRDAVARQLGYDPFREQAPLQVAVRVGDSARGIEGVVDWRDTDGTWQGERRFLARGGNCSQLLVEMSFSVAIQIHFLTGKPRDLLPVPATAPPEAPPPAPATAPPEAPPPAPPTAAASASAWDLAAGGGVSLSLATSPSATAAFRAFAAARRNALSAEIGAVVSLPSTFSQPGGSGFHETTMAASAAFCGHLKALSGCALGQIGELRVRGFGVDQPLSHSGLLAQTGIRLAAALPLGRRWLVMTHVDALGLLTPIRVELNHLEVWRMPRFGVLAGIDLAARFP